MEVKKRYCASSQVNLHLVLEDGKKMILNFSGYDQIKKEYFIDVTDPLVQNAVEKTKFFNFYFYKSDEFLRTEMAAKSEEVLVNAPVDETPVESTEETVVETPVESTEETVVETVVESTEEKVDEVSTIVENSEPELIEKEFGSGKDAKYWLNENFNVPFNRLANNQMITAEFLALGMKLALTSKN